MTSIVLLKLPGPVKQAIKLLTADLYENREDLLGEVRVHEAIALARLGKLSLAEQELRNALRRPEGLSDSLRVRALVTLASIHAQQGERFLSELEANKAYEMAAGLGLETWQDASAPPAAAGEAWNREEAGRRQRVGAPCDPQCRCRSDARWQAVQSVPPVHLDVLTGVENVESAHPACDGDDQQEGRPAQRRRIDRQPRCRG